MVGLKTKLLFVTGIVILASSCGIYETKTDPSVVSAAIVFSPETRISYAVVAAQVFNLNSPHSCSPCHTARAAGGVSLKSYADVIANLSKVQGTVFNGDPVPMPSAGLSDQQKQLLRQWIDQGAPEIASNPSDPVATPEPSPEATPVLSASPTPSPTPSPTVAPAQLTATYASIQSLVFDQKCVICHSPTSTDPDAANEALDSYAGIMAAGNKLLVAGDGVNSKIITKIVAGKMPPANSGIPAVTADELAAIKTWIMNGATP